MQSGSAVIPSLADQRVVLLEKEVARLLKLVEKLCRELAKHQGQEESEQLELELSRTKENLDQALQRLYGDSSERLEVETVEPMPEPPAPARRGHGPRRQPKLPVEVVDIELPEGERSCPSCSGELEQMTGQAEQSEQVSVIERVYYLKKIRRRKYRCRCQSAVVTAPAPTTHLPGGRYSLVFAALVAVDKYVDHLPLDRQAKRMARQGLDVSSQTLWDQLDALWRLLEPACQRLRERICQSSLVHADETPWKLLDRRKGKKAYAWSICDGDSIYFDFLRGRSAADAATVLEGFRGRLVCDGYSAYATFSRGSPGIELVGCWAHVRRKFREAGKGHAKQSREALERIAQLYQLEHCRPELSGLEGRELEEVRALDDEIRGVMQRAVVLQLEAWADSLRASPQSSLARAVKYMKGRWSELTRFLDDPELPLDNNQAERTLRGPVLGRKIHYGSRSRDGCRAAACFYSLLETCKLHGVDPHRYLVAAATAAIESATVLLPQDLA